MSTQYITDPDYGNIPFKELKSLTLEENKIYVQQTNENVEDSVCLTDGNNFLWAYGSEEGIVHSFSRYGPNDVEFIIQRLQEIFGVELIDEYSDRYQELSREEFGDDEDDSESSLLEQEYLKRNEE